MTAGTGKLKPSPTRACAPSQRHGKSTVFVMLRTVLANVRYFLWFAMALVLPWPAAAQTSVGQGVPALRVIAPNGASSVLIGSLHIAATRLQQPDASVMNGAKRYVVESSTTQGPQPTALPLDLAPEVIHRLLATKGVTRADWAAGLTEAHLKTFREYLGCAAPGVNLDEVAGVLLSIKTARYASEIASHPCPPAGLLSRDVILEHAAVERGVRMFILESQVDVEARRRAIPERIYRDQIYRAFTPEWHKGLRRVVNALNTGNYDAITDVQSELFANPADAEVLRKTMVVERNHEWLPVLTGYLDEGAAVVNVGAAHLPGPDGLIALLREGGYRVESIQLPVWSAH